MSKDLKDILSDVAYGQYLEQKKQLDANLAERAEREAQFIGPREQQQQPVAEVSEEYIAQAAAQERGGHEGIFATYSNVFCFVSGVADEEEEHAAENVVDLDAVRKKPEASAVKAARAVAAPSPFRS